MNKKRVLSRRCAEPEYKTLISQHAESAYCSRHMKGIVAQHRNEIRKDAFVELEQYMKAARW